jgi:choline dehydrogenase-like flavoprotein
MKDEETTTAETLQTGIVVIGGGGGGLAAEVAASERGGNVVLLEKRSTPSGNASIARGIFAANVANVLLRKRVALEHFTDEFLRDLRVIDLAKKVKIVPTTATTIPEKWLAPKLWGADLTVEMKDGRKFSAHIDEPKGRLLYPLTKDEIKEKYRTNVAFSKTVSRENAEEALTMLDSLEEVDEIFKIVKLLVA